MGRHTKLTPEVQQRVVEAIQAGNYKETAAATSGINVATLYRWMEKGQKAKSGAFREFCDAVKGAEAEAEAVALSVIKKAANGYAVVKVKTMIDEDGNAHGREESRSSEFSWQAAAWYLERAHPSRWRRKDSREHTGKDGGPIEHTISVAELLSDNDSNQTGE